MLEHPLTLPFVDTLVHLSLSPSLFAAWNCRLLTCSLYCYFPIPCRLELLTVSWDSQEVSLKNLSKKHSSCWNSTNEYPFNHLS
uniref:Maf protein n=1 Tax=Solanum tuberosum TaxID=4113 RepID=M0ZVE8_SOLTU